MKKILTTIAILICNILFAQLPVLTTTSLANPEDDMDNAKNGNYDMDTGNERNQYVGTWEYNQNGILFQLKLDKVDQVINKIEYNGVVSSYNYTDEIIVRYRLVKNGVELFNNLSSVITTIDTTTAYGIKRGSNDKMYGRLLDHTRNVIGYYTIKRLNTIPSKIIFNLQRFDYTLRNPLSYYQDGQPLFSMPMGGIEMVKIN